MFQNRINSFVPAIQMGGPPFAMPAAPQARSELANRFSNSVQLKDIYQAAKQRAVDDHELDKLFNAEYYDYQI